MKKFVLGLPKVILNREMYSKIAFCDFALWSFDCNLASSFSSKVVLSGKTERLAQRNKIKLRINPSFRNYRCNPATNSSTAASIANSTNQKLKEQIASCTGDSCRDNDFPNQMNILSFFLHPDQSQIHCQHYKGNYKGCYTSTSCL